MSGTGGYTTGGASETGLPPKATAPAGRGGGVGPAPDVINPAIVAAGSEHVRQEEVPPPGPARARAKTCADASMGIDVPSAQDENKPPPGRTRAFTYGGERWVPPRAPVPKPAMDPPTIRPLDRLLLPPRYAAFRDDHAIQQEDEPNEDGNDNEFLSSSAPAISGPLLPCLAASPKPSPRQQRSRQVSADQNHADVLGMEEPPMFSLEEEDDDEGGLADLGADLDDDCQFELDIQEEPVHVIEHYELPPFGLNEINLAGDGSPHGSDDAGEEPMPNFGGASPRLMSCLQQIHKSSRSRSSSNVGSPPRQISPDPRQIAPEV